MQENDSVKVLSGVGDKTAALLNKLDIVTIGDLIHYYPSRYDVFEPPKNLRDIEEGNIAAIRGVLTRTAEVKNTKNMQLTVVTLQEDDICAELVWFRMPFLKATLRAGCRFIFRGKCIKRLGKLIIQQPEIYTLSKYDEICNSLQPMYTVTKGLSNKTVSKAVKNAIQSLGIMTEYMPAYLRKENELAEYNFALEHIHFPRNKDELFFARKRLVFDEFLLFILTVRKWKDIRADYNNSFNIVDGNMAKHLEAELPYDLTNAQKQVLEEVVSDITSKKVMNRLIQGDVGSGKTIIAIMAMLHVVEASYQAALMAPTEVLAKQHYEAICEMSEKYNLKVRPILLTGSITAKEKREAYSLIKAHEADIIIGTHALIQEKVEYDNLALVITDEQHRFGVKQREYFSNKGSEPHVLVMSATPIPRTLAMIIYGDLDISVIDELPADRLPIKNAVITKEDRNKTYTFMEKEIKSGRQVYVICPMVEESENADGENVIDYTKMLRQVMSPSINVEYLHGKMKAKEKNQKMEDFSQGKIHILVSTTVIEVGINVPNATVMVIENASKFGLAQLHQLRGRVGRGKHQSYCIFISDISSKETLARLEILRKSNDGFYIASEDLKLRGAGDILGVRQSGLMEFDLGDIFTDSEVLKTASEAAGKLIKRDALLEEKEHILLKKELEKYSDRSGKYMTL